MLSRHCFDIKRKILPKQHNLYILLMLMYQPDSNIFLSKYSISSPLVLAYSTHRSKSFQALQDKNMPCKNLICN